MIDKLVKECTEILGTMRDATKEERNSIQKYVNSISEDTGINFGDILDKEKEKRNEIKGNQRRYGNQMC